MSNIPRITVNNLGDEEGSQKERYQNTLEVVQPEIDKLRLNNAQVRASYLSNRWKSAPDGQDMHILDQIDYGVSTSRRKSMFAKNSDRNSLEGFNRNIGDAVGRKKNGSTEPSARRKSSVLENMESVRRRVFSLKSEIDASAAFIGVLTRHGSARPRTPRKVLLKKSFVVKIYSI
jgi:hypothetical protein